MFRNKNDIPYIVMVLMGVIIYFLWSSLSDANTKIKEQEGSIELTYEAMSILQSYNEKRFIAIEKIKKEKWNHGKNTGKY